MLALTLIYSHSSVLHESMRIVYYWDSLPLSQFELMRTFITILILIILAGGGWYWYSSMQTPTDMNTNMNDPFGEMQNTNTGTNNNTTPGANTGTNTGGGAGTSVDVGANVTTGALKEITVTSSGMTFNPKTLTVKKGDRVRITFTNGGGTHDLRVDGYNVGTKVISGGASETFEFVADQAGSFEYYCSVGSHRAMGMKGTLTVTQ